MARTGGVVYLLHFDQPLAHARHYMGSARSLRRRLREHETSQGGRLVQVIRALGIGYEVARVWKCATVREARLLEARMKRWNNGRRLCPLCRATPAASCLEVRGVPS